MEKSKDLLKKKLTEYFTLKFRFRGEELLDKVLNFNWESIQGLNEEDFIRFVKENHYDKENDNRTMSVSIPIPKK